MRRIAFGAVLFASTAAYVAMSCSGGSSGSSTASDAATGATGAPGATFDPAKANTIAIEGGAVDVPANSFPAGTKVGVAVVSAPPAFAAVGDAPEASKAAEIKATAADGTPIVEAAQAFTVSLDLSGAGLAAVDKTAANVCLFAQLAKGNALAVWHSGDLTVDGSHYKLSLKLLGTFQLRYCGTETPKGFIAGTKNKDGVLVAEAHVTTEQATASTGTTGATGTTGETGATGTTTTGDVAPTGSDAPTGDATAMLGDFEWTTNGACDYTLTEDFKICIAYIGSLYASPTVADSLTKTCPGFRPAGKCAKTGSSGVCAYLVGTTQEHAGPYYAPKGTQEDLKAECEKGQDDNPDVVGHWYPGDTYVPTPAAEQTGPSSTIMQQPDGASDMTDPGNTDMVDGLDFGGGDTADAPDADGGIDAVNPPSGPVGACGLPIGGGGCLRSSSYCQNMDGVNATTYYTTVCSVENQRVSECPTADIAGCCHAHEGDPQQAGNETVNVYYINAELEDAIQMAAKKEACETGSEHGVWYPVQTF